MRAPPPRAAVAGIGCASPQQTVTRREWLEFAHLLAPSNVDRGLLARIAEGSQIDSRGLATMRPDVREAQHEPHADPRGPGTGTRIAEWASAARPLAAEAAGKALEDAGISPEQVTHVVTASCTGFSAPGVDQWLIWDLGLPVSCRRTHLGFMGCHASINSLAVADAFARSQPGAVVLMTAVEICTAHMHYGSRIDRLIANSIFADGAAAAVVTCDAPENAPRIATSGSTLVDNTADEVAWIVGDNGFEMTLSPSVPKHLRREVGPWVRSWLAQSGLTPEHVGGWAIHPGGPRIVEAIAQALHLSPEACEHSCDVLRQHGNMSAATVMFVMHRLRNAGVPRPWAAMSFGPGLAGEALLFVDAHHPHGNHAAAHRV
jgi:predicted naringenin-chalcone synthase